MDPEEEVKTPTVPAPAEGEEVAEDDEDEFDEELEEEEEDDANCSEDETPSRDENVAPHEYLLDCSYEAIKICNIDFLTDFGSAEPFLVDGDALVALTPTWTTSVVSSCCSAGRASNSTAKRPDSDNPTIAAVQIRVTGTRAVLV